jgi:hypothetical protein
MTLSRSPYRALFLAAVALAILVRVSAFVFTLYNPISDGGGGRISPLLVVSAIDFEYYRVTAMAYFGGEAGSVIESLKYWYQHPEEDIRLKIAGPILPLFIYLFDYGEGNTLPLSICYLVISILLCGAWLRWLDLQGIPGGWLVLFAVVPNPLWFMLAVSPDLLFAALFFGFYIYYFRDRWSKPDVFLWAAFAMLLMITRPHAMSIILFIFIDLVRRRYRGPRLNLSIIVGVLSVALIVITIFMYPYLNSLLKGSQTVTYFGLTPGEYYSGIYDALPLWLDRALSAISLFGAKILYTVGLRPSYGGTALHLVLMRSAVGLVMLPGLVYIAIKGDWPHRLLIALILLPVLLAASQDRYLLFIQPVIFLFGAKAYMALWSMARGRVEAQLRRPERLV